MIVLIATGLDSDIATLMRFSSLNEMFLLDISGKQKRCFIAKKKMYF